MFTEKEVTTSKLFLAALLLAIGGRLVRVDASNRRLSLITIEVSSVRQGSLQDLLERLGDSLPPKDTNTSIDEFEFVVDSSLLGTIETNYHRLKKLVLKARDARNE